MPAEEEKKTSNDSKSTSEPKPSESPKSAERITKEEMLKAMNASYQVTDAQINMCNLGQSKALSMAKTKLEESWLWFRSAVEQYQPKPEK